MKKKNCKEYRRHDLKENVLKQRKSYIPKKNKNMADASSLRSGQVGETDMTGNLLRLRHKT